MQCQFVVNTYELESAAREHYTNISSSNGDGTCTNSSSIDAVQRRYWEEVIMPRLAARTQKIHVHKSTAMEEAMLSTTATVTTPSDLYTMGRIARFHRGCRSAKAFKPWRHHDTRCFAVGSMAMRRVCEEALAEGAATSHSSSSDNDCSHEENKKEEGEVIEYLILRDKFEGKPHPWRVLSGGSSSSGGGDLGSAALRSLLKSQHDKLDLPALLSQSSSLSSSSPLLQPLQAGSAFPLWNVSLSHHGPLVAVASHPTKAVGIDVMTIETTPPLLPAVGAGGGGEDGDEEAEEEDPNYPSHAYYRRCAERHWAAAEEEVGAFFEDFVTFFTKEEWGFIRSGAAVRNGATKSPGTFAPTNATKSSAYYQLKRFHTLWTLKESYIKAIGIGLGLDLQRARFEVVAGEEGEGEPASGDGIASSSSSPSAAGSSLSTTPISLTTTTVLHHPRHITLFIDGVPQHDWRFAVYDLGDALNAVVAIAEGPMDIAARHSCWGRCVVSEAAKMNAASSSSSSPTPSSSVAGAAPFPSLPRPLKLMSLKELITQQ